MKTSVVDRQRQEEKQYCDKSSADAHQPPLRDDASSDSEPGQFNDSSIANGTNFRIPLLKQPTRKALLSDVNLSPLENVASDLKKSISGALLNSSEMVCTMRQMILSLGPNYGEEREVTKNQEEFQRVARQINRSISKFKSTFSQWLENEENQLSQLFASHCNQIVSGIRAICFSQFGAPRGGLPHCHLFSNLVGTVNLYGTQAVTDLLRNPAAVAMFHCDLLIVFLKVSFVYFKIPNFNCVDLCSSC